jgi:hypothetical protein
MEAGKNSVIYMGLISGPNKADDTCGRTTVTERWIEVSLYLKFLTPSVEKIVNLHGFK